MPIPVHPRTFSCPACRWQRTTLPKSDCLIEGIDWHSRCPQCLHTALDYRLASRVEIMGARLDKALRRPRF